jgi:hypothetical protein
MKIFRINTLYTKKLRALKFVVSYICSVIVIVVQLLVKLPRAGADEAVIHLRLVHYDVTAPDLVLVVAVQPLRVEKRPGRTHLDSASPLKHFKFSHFFMANFQGLTQVFSAQALIYWSVQQDRPNLPPSQNLRLPFSLDLLIILIFNLEP